MKTWQKEKSLLFFVKTKFCIHTALHLLAAIYCLFDLAVTLSHSLEAVCMVALEGRRFLLEIKASGGGKSPVHHLQAN